LRSVCSFLNRRDRVLRLRVLGSGKWCFTISPRTVDFGIVELVTDVYLPSETEQRADQPERRGATAVGESSTNRSQAKPQRRPDVPPAAAPPRPRALQKGRKRRRWDCINARQRERAKESRFAACASLLTFPASRRPPPKCGAFRLQPQGSLLRQTDCWREVDSNLRSRFCEGLRWALPIRDGAWKAKPPTGRDGDDAWGALPIVVPFAMGPRVRIRLPPAGSLRTSGPSAEGALPQVFQFEVGPRVRIRLPPAVSLLRTWTARLETARLTDASLIHRGSPEAAGPSGDAG
jgi:hypothetical protein